MRDSWLFPYRPFDVAAFFRRIGSPRLADMPDLPAWIDEAARQYDLRAEWLCGLVQKEQSALTKRTLSQHGRDWLCGYGYTEGPVYVQFKGARNQVFSAARGLRRYLTPGDSLYVGEWVGEVKTFGGESREVRSLVEAVCLQYTPYWSTLTTVERIWQQYGFEDGGESMATTRDVERIAREICAKFARGYRGGLTIGQIHFELDDTGWCSEFVREVCEAAAGTPNKGPLTTRYFGGTARETEAKLKARGTGVPEAQAVPGDIVCFNRGAAGNAGHIGIHLGNGDFAENTSSTGRGPGFVISRYTQIGRDRISGFYHLPEFDCAQAPGPPKVILGRLSVPNLIECNARLEEGTTRVDLRGVVEGMGMTLMWDPATNKSYIDVTCSGMLHLLDWMRPEEREKLEGETAAREEVKTP